MAGLIAEILLILFFIYNTVYNGLKMSEYDTDWQKGFSLINSQACAKK